MSRCNAYSGICDTNVYWVSCRHASSRSRPAPSPPWPGPTRPATPRNDDGYGAAAVCVLANWNGGSGACQVKKKKVCFRDCAELTIHHMIPRLEYARYMRKGYSEARLKGAEIFAMICRPCHNTVHRLASNDIPGRADQRQPQGAEVGGVREHQDHAKPLRGVSMSRTAGAALTRAGNVTTGIPNAPFPRTTQTNKHPNKR